MKIQIQIQLHQRWSYRPDSPLACISLYSTAMAVADKHTNTNINANANTCIPAIVTLK